MKKLSLLTAGILLSMSLVVNAGNTDKSKKADGSAKATVSKTVSDKKSCDIKKCNPKSCAPKDCHIVNCPAPCRTAK